MDSPPARRAASKSRNRLCRRRRRAAGAAAETGAGSEVLSAEQGATAQGNAATAASSSSSRRRDRRRRRRRNRAAKATAEASKSPEAHVLDIASIQGGSSQHSSVSLPQTTTKKIFNSNETKRNFQDENKTTKVYSQDGAASYSLSHENFVGGIEALRAKFFKQFDVRSRCDNYCASGNADTDVDYQNDDPECPVIRKINLSKNSEVTSPSCRSLQELEEHKENETGASIYSSILNEEKKKKSKRKGGKRCDRCKEITSQDCPLPNRADDSDSVVMVSKENSSCLPIINSVWVDGAKTKEEESVNSDSTVTERNKLQEQDITVSGEDTPYLPMINSFLVNDLKTKEEESVNLDSTVTERNKLQEQGIMVCEENTLCLPMFNSVLVDDANTKQEESVNLNSTVTERNKPQEQDVACSGNDNTSCLGHSNLAEAYVEKLKVEFLQRQSFRKKKLLILDLNGLLADINDDYHNAHMADAKVRGKLVFRRPYCDDFLKFCSLNFDLGIWSSRKKENVASVVNIVMRDFRPRLLFCWDMSKCTFTGCKTLENKHKPLMLKELRRLWNKEEPDLPWEEGDYSPSNTLLVDDSPYKALLNPPHTAIFPRAYSYLNWNDNSLGPGGDLRVYLQNLAAADDVESYVRNNPFGQPFITENDPHWNFYAQITDKRNAVADKGASPLTCCA